MNRSTELDRIYRIFGMNRILIFPIQLISLTPLIMSSLMPGEATGQA